MKIKNIVKSLALLLLVLITNIKAQAINPYDFQYSATVTGKIQLNGEAFNSAGATILAYSTTGELRGKVETSQLVNGNRVYFLMVYLRGTDNIEIKVLLPGSDVEVPVSTTYQLAPDQVKGSPLNPEVLIIEHQVKISGYALLNGNPLDGITEINYGSGNPLETNSQGYYEFYVNYNWSGNITVSNECYNFTNNSMQILNVQKDLPDQNFTVDNKITYVVSGVISGAGIDYTQIFIDFGDGGTTSPDANGNFSKILECNWEGDVTPYLEGHEFSPPSYSIDPLHNNRAGLDFTIDIISIKIDGFVTNAGNLIGGGAKVDFDPGGEVYTDTNEYYEFYVPWGWTGTVSVTHPCFNSNPTKIYDTPVTENLSSQNYYSLINKKQNTISGNVKTLANQPIGSVTITLSNGGGSTTTNSNGEYVISVDCGWSGEVSASKEGFIFLPAQHGISNIQGDTSEIDFTSDRNLWNANVGGRVVRSDDNSVGIPNVTAHKATWVDDHWEDHQYMLTDENGYFHFGFREGWSGNVSVQKYGVTFENGNDVNFTDLSSPPSSLVFVGSVWQNEISGYVTGVNNKPVSNVSIVFSNGEGTVATDSSGYYKNYVDYQWSGTAAPQLDGYTFTPLKYSYDSVETTISNQNFDANGTIKELFVDPTFTYLPAIGGKTKISIENKGNAHMNWSASVTQGTDWISIDSGAGGLDNGTIYFSYEPLVGTERTGTITVSADGAINSPQTIEIKQEFGFGNEVKLNVSNTETGYMGGKHVALSGDYAIVGSTGDNNNTGAAYIYKKYGGVWTFLQIVYPSDGAENDEFGWSVDIDGIYAVVGARRKDVYKGAAYVFKFNGNNWIEVAKLSASNGSANDQFGYSVSISDNYIFIGAMYHNYAGSFSGAVYFYEKPSSGWSNMTETQILYPSDAYTGDNFGMSVSVSNDLAIIGAPRKYQSGIMGTAYLFKREASNWMEIQKTFPEEMSQNSFFGWSCNINDNIIAVASDNYAYLYNFDGINLNLESKLKPIDEGKINYYSDISVTKSFAVVTGMPKSENLVVAYIFKREEDFTSQTANWYHYSTIVPGGNIYYGSNPKSVAINNVELVVAAPSHNNNKGSVYFYNAPYFTGPGQTYSISGTITNSSSQQPIENVVVNFTNGGGSSITNANGNYSKQVEFGWNGKVEPDDLSFTFDPIDRSYTDVSNNISNANFDATEAFIDISGIIVDENSNALEGIELTFTGESSVITDTIGYYSKTLRRGWSGTILPSKLGYVFTPDTIQFVSQPINVTDLNFIGTLTYHTISGNIKDEFMQPIEGAIISFEDVGETVTDGNGNYTIQVLHGWDGTATPSKSGYVFTPSVNTYNNITSNLISQNFTVTVKEFDFNLELVIEPEDGIDPGKFGWVSDISDRFLVIGAYTAQSTGQVYVYEFKDYKWQLNTILNPDPGSGRFGYSVAINENYIIVGAPLENSSIGAAYIYFYNGSEWLREAKIADNNIPNNSYFGETVDITDGYAIVGAPGYDIFSWIDYGAAYIYKKNGTNWVKEAGGTGASVYAKYGRSVAISGETAIIGFFENNQYGAGTAAAHVYKKVDGNWISKRIVPSDGFAGNDFGGSVDIMDDKAFIGCLYGKNDDNQQTGAVYVFEFESNDWIQKSKICPNSGVHYEEFGCSVSIFGDYLAVGARKKTHIGEYYKGKVYVFKNEGTSWEQKFDIISPNTSAYDQFGNTVAIHGENIVAGKSKTGSVHVLGNILNYNPHVISGNIVDEENNPRASVEIVFPYGIKDTTDAEGNFSRIVPEGWKGYVKPYMFGIEFNPSQYSYGNVTHDLVDQNFTSQPLDIVFNTEMKVFADDGLQWDYYGNSVAVNGEYAIVGAYYNDEVAPNSGAAYIYRYENNSMVLKQKLVPGSQSSSEMFGTSASISENYAIVCSSNYKVYIYHKENDSTWVLQNTFTNTAGNVASISENYAAVGGISQTIHVFKRNGDTWVSNGQIYSSIGGSEFGSSIAISGESLIVGAPYENNNIGTAYIYTLKTSTLVKKIEPTTSYYFGKSVSIYGDYAAIGAWPEKAVYIYKFNGSTWLEEAKLLNEQLASFGDAVKVYENYMAASSKASQKLLVYKNINDSWVLHKEILPPGVVNGYGTSLDFNSEFLVVGAPGDNGKASNEGAIYIYGDSLSQQANKRDLLTDEAVIPKKFLLSQNYPNPFNPVTQINYALPVKSDVRIKIYDITGRLIKSFISNSQSAGYQSVEWDGRNSNGIKAASGVYIYRMEAIPLEGKTEPFIQTRKMILLK